MSNLTSQAFGFALVVSSLLFNSVVQAQTKPFSKAATGTVSGRVTVKGKGAPGIAVAVRDVDFSSRSGTSLKATTDQDGNYRITNVLAGNYQVAPLAPAFVISDLNIYGSGGKGLVIAEGEDVDGIDFALVRGGVITGKVIDPDGRPIIDERIDLVRVDPTSQQGPTSTFSFGGFQTDDRGIYRIFGLPSGRYKLAVGASEAGFSRSVGMGRPAYKQTFHPDVTDSAKTAVIELAEGVEVTNVDIAIGRAIQSFAAGGRVFDGESGKPMADVRIGLQMMADGRNSFTSTNAISNSKGEFRIDNITPGKYAAGILSQQGRDLTSDAVMFEVVDQNVTGLMVKTSQGASVSGVVTLENTDDKKVFATLAQLRLQVYVHSEGLGSRFWQSSLIGPNGSFRVGGLGAGSAHFSLGAQDRSLLKGFVISRVEREGGVQPRGLEVKSGEQISGLRIVINYGTGKIRGVVNFENGPLPSGARVMLQLTRLGESQSNMRAPEVDSRGHFLIESLSSGNYEIVATAYVPGLRQRPLSAKQLVSVENGTVTEVTLTVDLKENPLTPDR